mmetsp:Transcript_64623/g.204007  ORF Transcript_64623/g.204007 Transcript_64623/m.204007 type:complete len:207 (+) Transcript_64623:364-984(+)
MLCRDVRVGASSGGGRRVSGGPRYAFVAQCRGWASAASPKRRLPPRGPARAHCPLESLDRCLELVWAQLLTLQNLGQCRALPEPPTSARLTEPRPGPRNPRTWMLERLGPLESHALRRRTGASISRIPRNTPPLQYLRAPGSVRCSPPLPLRGARSPALGGGRAARCPMLSWVGPLGRAGVQRTTPSAREGLSLLLTCVCGACAQR